MRIVLAAAVLGLSAVILGAWGAHGLPDLITHVHGNPLVTLGNGTVIDPIERWWESGVRLQMWHALALLALAALRLPRGNGAVASCWIAGTLIFAGTLYAMTLGGPRWLGAVTPLGGVLLILGWAILGVVAWRQHRQCTTV
jgi:uncharacterized membrane protein YgdD (TMEM256/DUF423 family)